MNIADFSLFRGLSETEVQTIIARSSSFEKPIAKDAYVFQQGETPRYIYLLLEGGVQVEGLGPDGRRTILNRFTKPGTMFAEVYAYLDRKTYDYSCIATEDTRVLCIPKELLMRHTDDPLVRKLLFNMLSILSEKAYGLNQKLLIVMEQTLRQKILQYLHRVADEHGTADLSFNREEMAAYLGTTRPSLSRELRNMEEEGLIRIDKNRITICTGP